MFGAESDAAVKSGRVVTTVQAIGGTGGLKIGADFLKKMSAPPPRSLISPTRAGKTIKRHLRPTAGFERAAPIAYYDAVNQQRREPFEGMLADLERGLPAGTIVVLHACCHNPTGYRHHVHPSSGTR